MSEARDDLRRASGHRGTRLNAAVSRSCRLLGTLPLLVALALLVPVMATGCGSGDDSASVVQSDPGDSGSYGGGNNQDTEPVDETPPVDEEPEPSSSYEIGASFEADCVVAWPTAPARTSNSIQMNMNCAGVPDEYMLTQVAYGDPNVEITPNTGRIGVRGTVVDVAQSEQGFQILMVSADELLMP